MDDKPLVSFCLKFYRQKELIDVSLNAAFAQTYSPLEIVVSDDGSNDGSAEKINAIVADYIRGGGAHKVMILHNEKNIGSARTCERQFKASHGDLLVQADGDDISTKNRVNELVAAWVKSGKEATLLVSHAIEIDASGRHTLGLRRMGTNDVVPFGAVSAYSRKVVDCFNPIVFGDTADDVIFSKRALLYGKQLLVDKPLLYYRLGLGMSSEGGFFNKRIRCCKSAIRGTKQIRLDINHVEATSSDLAVRNRVKAARRRHRNYVLRYYAELEMLTGKNIRRRFLAWKVYCHLWKHPLSSVVAQEYLMIVLPPAVIGRFIAKMFDFYWSKRNLLKAKKFDMSLQC